MSFENNNTEFTNNNNSEFGRSAGGHDSKTGTAGFGSAQNDQYSSNTAGGHGQGASDPHNNTGSNMNDSMHGSSQGTDNFGSGAGAYDGGSSAGNQLGSGGRDDFNGNTMGGSGGKIPMGDKLKGETEKLPGKVMGNSGLQERGQERKMGESNNNDF
ncbi:hypothetical protein B0H10DRAFT_2008791 [Mycena sp. CBHHK59/15]|nr:hypothetical protein B0H10DRAFT_2008791 [Mycena sp. CBHHK59/15]